MSSITPPTHLTPAPVEPKRAASFDDALRDSGGPSILQYEPASKVQLDDPLFLEGPGPTPYPGPVKLHPLGLWVFSDVFVAGKGVIFDPEGRLYLCPSVGVSKPALEHGLFGASVLEPEGDGFCLRVPPTVTQVPVPVGMLVQPGDGVFGHWILDLLPRLELLRAGTRHVLSQPNKWLVMSSESLDPSCVTDADDLLQLAGLQRREILPFHSARSLFFCSKLVVPTQS
jgi:hypothetical protein